MVKAVSRATRTKRNLEQELVCHVCGVRRDSVDALLDHMRETGCESQAQLGEARQEKSSAGSPVDLTAAITSSKRSPSEDRMTPPHPPLKQVSFDYGALTLLRTQQPYRC